MFALKISVLFLCTIFVYTDSAFVDNIKKCSIKDSECIRNMLQTILRSIGKSGIPEYDIPPTDPYELKNLTVPALGIVNITLIDGVAKGVKSCEVNKFVADLDTEEATMELKCDLTIKGKYKADGSSPIIANMLGGATVHGEGKAKVVIDKIHMKFDYNFLVKKKEDGEFYLDCRPDQLKFAYDIGNINFAASNLYLGETEASALIIGIMNDNWKFVMETAGKPFMDKARDIIYEQTHKFFDRVPAKYYLTDDLSPYVKE